MAADSDDLVAWIDELRTRMARGELDGQGDFAVGGSVMPVGVAARIFAFNTQQS